MAVENPETREVLDPGFNVQDTADLPLAIQMDSYTADLLLALRILESGPPSPDHTTLFGMNEEKLEIVGSLTLCSVYRSVFVLLLAIDMKNKMLSFSEIRLQCLIISLTLCNAFPRKSSQNQLMIFAGTAPPPPPLGHESPNDVIQ